MSSRNFWLEIFQPSKERHNGSSHKGVSRGISFFFNHKNNGLGVTGMHFPNKSSVEQYVSTAC